jgi:hypothetical protein
VSWLPTALLLTPLAQTARSRFLQPITRRRLAAIAAVLGSLILQGGDPERELANRPFKQRHDRLLSLQEGLMDLFAGWHYKACHGIIVAGLYDFGKPN